MNPEFLLSKEKIDRALAQLMENAIDNKNPLKEGMVYAVTAPGKRIRGVLTLAFCQRLGVTEAQAMPFALALETRILTCLSTSLRMMDASYSPSAVYFSAIWLRSEIMRE